MSDSRILSLLSGGDVFADLGCGSGHFIDRLVSRYDSCIGMDRSDVRLDMRKKNRKVEWEYRGADLNKRFPLDSESVDGVLANQVIEHILDPGHSSSEIFRILKKGGIVVITTLNIRYLKHVYRLVFEGKGPCTAGGNTLDGSWDDGHVNYFTHRDLRWLFVSRGFSVVHSQALIDMENSGLVHKLLDRPNEHRIIRNFFQKTFLFIWPSD